MKTYIVIGTSAAGISVVKTLVRLKVAARIICISSEKELPYNKCFLADFLSNDIPENNIYTFDVKNLENSTLTFLLNKCVESIVSSEKRVILSDGQSISYDTLFVGTGASPFIPQIQGINTVKGVYTFHTLADTFALLEALKIQRMKKVMILGAGLSGLECADALRSHGVEVLVADLYDRVLKNYIDSAGSKFIQERMHTAGVSFLGSEKIIEIREKNGWVYSVVFESGKEILVDSVIIATGVRANLDLCEQANLKIKNGGVTTTQKMETTVPYIYAGGDVACIKNKLTGEIMRSSTWPDAMAQGLVAAHAMIGSDRVYAGSVPMLSSSFFGIKFMTCGELDSKNKNNTQVRYDTAELYQVTHMKDNRLQGFISLGKTHQTAVLRRAVMTQEIYSDINKRIKT